MNSPEAASGYGNVSFETSLAELEAIVHDLEEGQLGLTEALTRYEQGVKHLKRCHELLSQAERRIELLTGVADNGTPIAQPLDDTAEPTPQAGRRRARKPPRSASPLQAGPADDDIDDSAAGT